MEALMMMSKEKQENSVSHKATNKRFQWPERSKKFWVICAWYSCFLTTLFIIVSSSNWRTNTLISSFGQRLIRPTPKTPRHKNWHNVLVSESSNYTSTLTDLLLLSATSNTTCHTATTNATELQGLPFSVNGHHIFSADELHHLTLVAYDENGERRCAGGDYYEVDFHDRDNMRYRSRLPTTDFGDGTYGLQLLVPSRFAGVFTLDIFLLYGNWHGLEQNTFPWANKQLLFTLELEVVDGGEHDDYYHHKTHTPKARKKPFVIKQCTPDDFDRTTWQGRWTRSWYNTHCAPDEGTQRYRCVPDEHFSCEEPWCFGPMGRLDSNGWQYSAHCGFKIFQRDDAWKCLNGRWFMMWGDSNFQDTIRNLLLFILDWQLPSSTNLADFQLSRTYEMAFTNSHGYDQLFRVSSLFNGANFEHDNNEGLNTLRHKEHQDLLRAHFNGKKWPDTVIMNSGLHDGVSLTVQEYAEAADFMIAFWMEIYKSLPAARRPQLVWRASVAPAGIGRAMPSNPNKMEVFNQVMAEKLQAVHDEMPVKFIDTFDLTFPFHYDNEFSDGGHYGRAPGVDLWPWFRKPHWYFVDIMLAHIFLNALCPST